MRHLKKGRKFGRERDQRRALLKSMASSFFILGRIKTTEAKAKELRPYVEKIVSRVMNPDLSGRRYLARFFTPAVVKKVTEEAQQFKGHHGGYTRIIKLGERKSDGAKMAILELTRDVKLIK